MPHTQKLRIRLSPSSLSCHPARCCFYRNMNTNCKEFTGIFFWKRTQFSLWLNFLSQTTGFPFIEKTWSKETVVICPGKDTALTLHLTWYFLALLVIRNALCLGKLPSFSWPLFSCIQSKNLTYILQNCEKLILFSRFHLNTVVNQLDVFVQSLHPANFDLNRETWEMTGWIVYFSHKCFSII